MPHIAAIDFNAPSVDVARALFGAVLRVHGLGGCIVETEAYDAGAGLAQSAFAASAGEAGKPQRGGRPVVALRAEAVLLNP